MCSLGTREPEEAGEGTRSPWPDSAGLPEPQARPLFSTIPGWLTYKILETASVSPRQGTDPLSTQPSCADVVRAKNIPQIYSYKKASTLEFQGCCVALSRELHLYTNSGGWCSLKETVQSGVDGNGLWHLTAIDSNPTHSIDWLATLGFSKSQFPHLQNGGEITCLKGLCGSHEVRYTCWTAVEGAVGISKFWHPWRECPVWATPVVVS